MRQIGAVLLGAASVLSGCLHYNTLYNAERLYQQAELHRQAGRDSLAEPLYRDVIRKTADAYRGAAPDERLAPTLYLLGRAQLRAGDVWASRLALERAALHAGESSLAAEIDIYLAMAEARLGAGPEALARLEAALSDSGLSEAVRAEGLLLRGSLRLSDRSAATAWVDLDVAGVVPSVAVEAGLERLASSLRHDEPARAHAAVDALIANPAASERFDSISSLLWVAAAKWGPVEAAKFLAGADSVRWGQPARGRVLLERARLLHEANDTLAALAQVRRVATMRGAASAEARLLEAAWRLSTARDLGTIASVRPRLLPVADHPRAGALLEALDDVERYSGLGLDVPLGWFAAAEVARDRLVAPVLARGLFLAFADIDPSSPWAAKALLAALDVSGEEGDRAWLRGRLEAHRGSPYVLAARGGSPSGLGALEEELDVRLREIRGR
jgi:hypothetical protein